jgi:hypothetical protein
VLSGCQVSAGSAGSWAEIISKNGLSWSVSNFRRLKYLGVKTYDLWSFAVSSASSS